MGHLRVPSDLGDVGSVLCVAWRRGRNEDVGCIWTIKRHDIDLTVSSTRGEEMRRFTMRIELQASDGSRVLLNGNEEGLRIIRSKLGRVPDVDCSIDHSCGDQTIGILRCTESHLGPGDGCETRARLESKEERDRERERRGERRGQSQTLLLLFQQVWSKLNDQRSSSYAARVHRHSHRNQSQQSPRKTNH
jgi:hypothetical protein